MNLWDCIFNFISSFIGERAWKDLVSLTSYGPRVCGSHENDIRTVDAIVNALKKIQDTKLAVYELEYEVKRPTGAFEIVFMNDVFINSYQNVSHPSYHYCLKILLN